MSHNLLDALLMAAAIVWIGWGWRAGSRARDGARSADRRTGWRYGYGAGFVDAQRGRPYDLTPPADGRSRTLVDENPMPFLRLFRRSPK